MSPQSAPIVSVSDVSVKLLQITAALQQKQEHPMYDRIVISL